MSLGCYKKITNYQCGHFYKVEYTHCEGGHDDTEEENERCWGNQARKKRNAATTIETTDNNGGYCTRLCQAEKCGWHCCSCNQPVLPSVVYRNSENDLVHGYGDEEHECCNTCVVGAWA